VPTAAAFSGAAEAAVLLAHELADLEVAVEALMVTDRAGAFDAALAARVSDADLVLLCDGSALHARSVWRGTPVGAAITVAARVGAVGAVASLLGEVMVDPRGGAPTTGLARWTGVVVAAPAGPVQSARTAALVGDADTLVVVGATGAMLIDTQGWRALGGDVTATGVVAP